MADGVAESRPSVRMLQGPEQNEHVVSREPRDTATHRKDRVLYSTCMRCHEM